MNIRGFTLIELLVTLLCCAGLSLFGVISASFFKSKHERQIIVDEIQTAIHFAKIQAVTRGESVYLVPFEPTDNWSRGMKLIQYNRRKNTTELLHQWEWHHPLWSIIWKGASSVDKIILSNSPGSAISNGQFVVSNPYTKEQAIIVLNRLGRVKLA